MNKLLVSVFVLCLENQYDLMIPINISVKDAIELIQKSIFELTDHSYQINYNACLYDEDGKLCSVIETEVYFEILSPVPASSGSNDPEYRISDLIRDIKDTLKDFPNLRVNSYGEDMSYSGYGLFPLESYWLEDGYLVLEGEDHSMDYTR